MHDFSIVFDNKEYYKSSFKNIHSLIQNEFTVIKYIEKNERILD